MARYRKSRKRFAGKVASRVARKTYRGTRNQSKTRIRKSYATKTGQTAYRSAMRGKVGKKPSRFSRFKSRVRRVFKRKKRY